MAHRGSLPTDIGTSNFSFRLEYNLQSNISPYSQQVSVIQKSNPLWSFQVTLFPMGEQGTARDLNASILHSFLMSLEGPTHTFDLPIPFETTSANLVVQTASVVNEEVVYVMSNVPNDVVVGQWVKRGNRSYVITHIAETQFKLLPNINLATNFTPTSTVRVRLTDVPPGLITTPGFANTKNYEGITIDLLEDVL